MPHRGWTALLLSLLMVGGWGGVAAATTPFPTPPPSCFVMKGGALPTCDQNPDGSWTAVYPNGIKSTFDSTSGSGHSRTRRDIDLAIIVVAVVGIGGIAWWQWGPKRR